MNANATTLIPRREQNWRMGFANMFAKENISWWRTRRWWIQCLLWLVILNGNIELNWRGNSTLANIGMAFLTTAGMTLPIAAISLAQDAILGEKHSGTAAWVLSKPLRRPAFVLSKLIAYAFGFLVCGIVLPGVVAYFQLTRIGMPQLSPWRFAGAMGLVYLNLLFYLTLTMMLATLFNGRGAVLGISYGLALTGLLSVMFARTKLLVFLLKIMPWQLTISATNDPLAARLAVGACLPTLTPIIATALWCIVFVVVAVWRFCREEF